MGIDPVGVDENNVHSHNRYAYANNNPYRFVDPDGRVAQDIKDWWNDSVAGFQSETVGEFALKALQGLGPAEAVMMGGIGVVKGLATEAKTAGAAIEKGIEAANGLKITGFTGHGVERAIGSSGRMGVKPSAILDALKNPLKINKVVFDKLGRPSQRFVGKVGEVVANPETGRIISVNPTSTSKATKLLETSK